MYSSKCFIKSLNLVFAYLIILSKKVVRFFWKLEVSSIDLGRIHAHVRECATRWNPGWVKLHVFKASLSTLMNIHGQAGACRRTAGVVARFERPRLHLPNKRHTWHRVSSKVTFGQSQNDNAEDLKETSTSISALVWIMRRSARAILLPARGRYRWTGLANIIIFPTVTMNVITVRRATTTVRRRTYSQASASNPCEQK